MIHFGLNILSINDRPITEKTILLRVDFNIKIKDNNVIDDTRIIQALPTIKKLLKQKNKLILVTHFGKPEKRDKKFSVKPIATHLASFLAKYKIIVIDDFRNRQGQRILSSQKNNEIIFIENIRFYKEEKANDPKFAEQLAGLAEIYVNDAFGVCHRKHASVVGVSKYLPSYCGLLLEKEIQSILDALENSKKPSVAVIGGAKISTKLILIKKLIQKCSYVLVGGGIANTFFKAQKFQIGKSICEDDVLADAKKIIRMDEAKNKLIIPTDVIVEIPEKKIIECVSVDQVPDNAYIYDIGNKTLDKFCRIITSAKTIVFNGPVGFFENPKFASGTNKVIKCIAQNKKAKTVVGGGDTLAALPKKTLNKFDHVSTGGGAMLKLIENGTLPGLEALKK